MNDRLRPILLAIISAVVLAGCATTKATNVGAWSNWNRVPEPENRVDSLVQYQDYTTFTILPYSLLASHAVVAGDNERTTLFALANAVMERGYRYVESIDSADFMISERITDDFDSLEPLRPQLEQLPVFRRVTPYALPTHAFGSDAETPQRIDFWDQKGHPKVMIEIYSKQGRALLRWISGGVVQNPNLLHASQYLMRQFAGSLPMSKSFYDNFPRGTGHLGINMMIWSRDAINYWPEITSIEPGSPADAAGLRVTDMILEVNHQKMRNATYADVRKALRGDAGQNVSLKILRWDLPIRTYDIVLANGQGN